MPPNSCLSTLRQGQCRPELWYSECCWPYVEVAVPMGFQNRVVSVTVWFILGGTYDVDVVFGILAILGSFHLADSFNHFCLLRSDESMRSPRSCPHNTTVVEFQPGTCLHLKVAAMLMDLAWERTMFHSP